MKKAFVFTFSSLAIFGLFLFSPQPVSEPKSLSNQSADPKEISSELNSSVVAQQVSQMVGKTKPSASARVQLPAGESILSNESETRLSAIGRWTGAPVLESRVVKSRHKGFNRRVEVVKHPEVAHPIRVEALVSDSGDESVILQESAAQHVIIKVKEGIHEEELAGFLAEFEMKLGRQVSKYGLYLVETEQAKIDSTPEALHRLNDLATSHFIEYTTLDFLRHPAIVPNDPKFGESDMWGLDNPGLEEGSAADADIDAPEGWDIRTDASNIVVAVTDTGVRYTHEDLVANMWTNPGEIADNGIDDDGNGYIDDIHGVDTLFAADGAEAGDPNDDDGHGTHVAGTIGATGDNNLGVTGVAWKVQLMAVKSLGPLGGFDSNLIEGIDYAVDNGADIINASWGSPSFTQAVYDSIKRAQDAGIPFVAAAGNEGLELGFDNLTSYPADYDLPNILSVANHNNADRLDGSSNYSKERVDIAAPGTNILSTGIESDSDYVSLTGTSMAAPHVSGILALVKAQYPTDGYLELIERVMQGGESSLVGSFQVRSNARANLEGALEARTLRPNSPYQTQLNTVYGKAIVSWQHTWDEAFSGFRVLRSAGGLGFQIIGEVSPTTLRFEDQPTDLNQTYTYKVVAFSEAGESFSSPSLSLSGLADAGSEFVTGSLRELFYYDYGSFGTALDSQDELLAVSAYQDWDNGPEAGSVIIYDRFNNGQWALRQKLLASDGGAYHHFGNALSLDGNTLAIGAFHHDGVALDTGAVYLFERNADGVWLETQKITASDATEHDRFGYTLSLNGNSLAVTARDDAENGVASGSVYLYTRDVNGVWGNETKIVPSDGAVRQYFGWSVSLDGDRVAIGARGDATNGRYAGAVYLYTRPAGTNSWNLETKLMASNGSKYDHFGHAVSLKGDRLVVGAPNHDINGMINSGSAFAYVLNQGIWGGEQLLSAGDLSRFYHFGYSMDISEGRVLVGSNDLSFWEGGSYLYTIDAEQGWTHSPQKFALPLLDAEGESSSYFVPGLGSSLSLDENYVIMGSAYEDSIFTSVQ